MNSGSLIMNPMAQFNITEAMTAHPTSPKQPVEKAARGFEETFLAMLLKEMRASLEPDTLFGHDSGDVLGGMFDQFMAKHLTQAGGVGLARMMKQQLELSNRHDKSRKDLPRTTG